MKSICIISCLLLAFASAWGQDSSFGKIAITPYVSNECRLNDTATEFLITKLNQIVTENNVADGFERRFIITPSVNILSEKETASIPSKISMKVSITFFIGDGIIGTLFNSYNVEITGVGDDHNKALYSTIKKINTKDVEFQILINDAKKRIVSYYKSAAPILIKEAESFIASQDYESALSRLCGIPSAFKDYDKVKALISKCGSKIIERDNKSLLTKAKAVWSTSPNEDGAKIACDYLSQVVITSPYYQNEVNALTKRIQQRLIEIENKQIEFATATILSEKQLETERINASSRVVSSLINVVPSVIRVLSWF